MNEDCHEVNDLSIHFQQVLTATNFWQAGGLSGGRPRGKPEAKWVAGNGCSKFLWWVPYSNSLHHIPRSSKFPKNEGRGGVWATVWQWMADPEEYRSCNQRKAQPYNKLQISSLDGHGTGSALQFSGPLCRSKHVIARKNLLPELLPNATPYSYNSYVQSMPSAMKPWLPKSWLIINCQSWQYCFMMCFVKESYIHIVYWILPLKNRTIHAKNRKPDSI